MAVTRSRPDDTWGLLLLGFAALTVGQLLYAAQSAAGPFAVRHLARRALHRRPGAALPVGLVASRGPSRTSAEHSSAVTAVPGLATAAALVVLVDRVAGAAAGRRRPGRRHHRRRRRAHGAVGPPGPAAGPAHAGGAHRRADRAVQPPRAAARRSTRRSRPSPSGDLLLLELERFRQVNDTLGHSAGDQLLMEVARRLRRVLPARRGGPARRRQLRRAAAEPRGARPGASPSSCAPRSPSRSCSTAATSRSPPASRSPPGTRAACPAPASCCAARTPRCTPRKESGAPCEVWTTRARRGRPRAARARLGPAGGARRAPTSSSSTCSPSPTRARRRCSAVEALVRWRHPRRGPGPAGRLHRRRRAGRPARRSSPTACSSCRWATSPSCAARATRSRSPSTSAPPTCSTRASRPRSPRRSTGTACRRSCCASRSPRRSS